ncbi:MAG: trypsin-like peptidase domain-containing protein [Bacteriovorax sp.]|nr:trypsin-like peptidase domain-containing protein [Bacteriovorax sp.]
MARRFSFIVLYIGLFCSNAWSLESVQKNESAPMLENERNSISIFQNVADSVVNVSNMKKARSNLDMSGVEVESGMGSGFVWDKTGYIVTNFHVVDGGDSFLITFKDNKKQYRAKLVGADPKKDIAVLKLNETPKDLKPIIAGDSKNLQVGQKALAIGNPLGFDHSLTTGSVSALDRSIKGYAGVSINGMIQTDASINPGNSGGALLDSQGKLIGINTMIFNGAGASASAGLGFAIPVDTVKSVVPQLILYGKVIRPGLGIVVLEDFYAARFGLRDGVMLKYVDPKGPAAKIGMRGITRNRFGEYFLGDIITGIDNNAIKSYDDLFTVIDKYKIGDTVKIKYIRDNQEKTAVIKLVQI